MRIWLICAATRSSLPTLARMRWSDSRWTVGHASSSPCPPGFGPRHFVMLGHDRAVLVGELSAELALIELGSRARVLDVVPATPLRGAQPSGITARGRELIVANRVVGTVAAFTVDGYRLVRGEEIRLPATIRGQFPRTPCAHSSVSRTWA